MRSEFSVTTTLKTTETMKLSIPITSPEKITVGQYVDFHKAKTNVERCMIATGQSKEEILKTPRNVMVKVVDEFREFMHECPPTAFNKLVELDGTTYGFEPNLQYLETGAYVDLAHLEDIGIHENLDKYLAILYRPVTRKWGNKHVKYEIESYAANAKVMFHTEVWQDYPLAQAKGVCAFFLNLHRDLMKSSELKMMKELKKATTEMKSEILPN